MKKQIFKAKTKPNELVEFRVDEEECNKIGFVLSVTFDGCDQIFYCIQDMDSLKDESYYIFESVDEKDIIRILPDEEDFEETIKKLENSLLTNKNN